MDKANQRAEKIAQKLKMIEDRVNEKIQKLGFQTQFEELKNQGYQNLRFVMKALKLSKGDLQKAVDLINSFEEKCAEKSKNKENAPNECNKKERNQFKCHQKKQKDEEKDDSDSEIILTNDETTAQIQGKQCRKVCKNKEMKFEKVENVSNNEQNNLIQNQEEKISENQQEKVQMKQQEENNEKQEDNLKNCLPNMNPLLFQHLSMFGRFFKNQIMHKNSLNQENTKLNGKCEISPNQSNKNQQDGSNLKQEKVNLKGDKNQKQKEWMKYLQNKGINLEVKSEEKVEKKELTPQQIQKRNEKFPQYPKFNEEMKKLGFEDENKNFNVLKNNNGDENKAASQMKRQRILENLELCKELTKDKFQRVYIDCNNCFYLEKSFIKKAINGNSKAIEEQIAILMKIFQNKYGNNVEVILVFNDSMLLQDVEKSKLFYSKDFSMISAYPDFRSAEEAMVTLAQIENGESTENVLFVTSDRQLQAKLVENNIKNVMASKAFFNNLKEKVIGKRDYLQIIEA